MTPKISRRQMLKLMAMAAGGTGLAIMNRILSRAYFTADSQMFLPYMENSKVEATATPQPTPSTPQPTPSGSTPRVVHVHSSDATSWTGSPPTYWNYVNQNVVDTMVDQGVMRLTGANSVSSAWGAILPNYQPGQKIAIKVSFNNTDADQTNCSDNGGLIDGIIEPVNAIIRGLKSIGVPEADIAIYESIRNLAPYFVAGCAYPGVKMVDRGGCTSLTATFSSSDPNAVVAFSPPSGDPPVLHLNDVLINATYLINIPIMKPHGDAGLSLAMKNHYGSVYPKPGGLHLWSSLIAPNFTTEYSPIVDIYMNPHIRNKTVLTVADGIFSAPAHVAPPIRWDTFGNDYPKSLFFALDPVAVDSVMKDLISQEFSRADPEYYQKAGGYLAIAQNYGLGVYETGNPWATPASNGYSRIDYQKIEL